LAEVRATAGRAARSELFSAADFIAEVKYAAQLAAQVSGARLAVSSVAMDLAISGDRDLLYAAIGNLLQNAFKFTHKHTEVTLNAYAVADRILIEVKDHCGGLPAGNAEKMFLPFTQNGDDKSGLGLGLSIARRSAESNGGTLSAFDAKPINTLRNPCIFFGESGVLTTSLSNWERLHTLAKLAGDVDFRTDGNS
jgi:signal transduction histidine kinase